MQLLATMLSGDASGGASSSAAPAANNNNNNNNTGKAGAAQQQQGATTPGAPTEEAKLSRSSTTSTSSASNPNPVAAAQQQAVAALPETLRTAKEWTSFLSTEVASKLGAQTKRYKAGILLTSKCPNQLYDEVLRSTEPNRLHRDPAAHMTWDAYVTNWLNDLLADPNRPFEPESRTPILTGVLCKGHTVLGKRK